LWKLLRRRDLPVKEGIQEEFDTYLRLLETHNLLHKVLHTNAFFVKSSLVRGAR
jgi:hypothetical protein